MGACSQAPKRRGRDDVRVRSPFQTALMQTSLARTLHNHLEGFAEAARNTHRFRAIGYNSSLWPNQARDAALLKTLSKRAKDAGVKPLLLQVDDEGLLGEADRSARSRAIVAHHKWVDAAKALGCEALVVRAGAVGAPTAQADQLAEGLASLSNYTREIGLRLLVRSGGLGGDMSQNPVWLAGVLRRFDSNTVAALADVDAISPDPKLRMGTDEGMRIIMPFAAAIVMRGLESAEPLAPMPSKGSPARKASMIRRVLDDAIKGRGKDKQLGSGFRGYVLVDVQETSAAAEERSISATRDYLDAVAREYRDLTQ
jgi:hypothetical protein